MSERTFVLETLQDEFDRGWRTAMGEVAAAIGCNQHETIYAGELWAEKLRAKIAEATQAERERCARITKSVLRSARYWPGGLDHKGQALGEEIIRSIQEGGDA